MKKNIAFLITTILLLVITSSGCLENILPNNEQHNKVLINGKGEFESIQAAINAAENNDTIQIHNGVYQENIIINKSISLIGESRKNTIIDYHSTETGSVISIEADNCVVKGITITNTLYDPKKETTPEMGFVIGIKCNTSNNQILNNHILKTSNCIVLTSSNNNVIKGNFIENDSIGLEMYASNNNDVSNNNFSHSRIFGIAVIDSEYNVIHENAFYKNAEAGRIKGVHATNNRVYNNAFVKNIKTVNQCCGAKGNEIIIE